MLNDKWQMKNVLITGVSSGLGYGLAKAHLERGDTVYGLSRRHPRELEKNRNFHFAALDLTDYEWLPGILQSLLVKVTSLQLVYLNAGILGAIRDLADSPLPDLKEIMEVNCWANKEFLGALYKRVGQIDQVVAISSGAAVNGNRGWSGYALSKAALNMLVQLYAREQESTHFTSLAPGLIDTAMQDVLCGEVDYDRYASIRKLKDARGTDSMPMPREAADKIIDILPRLKDLPSGSFADIRKL
jgi:benzil reductase ((S)-benzoin forming)